MDNWLNKSEHSINTYIGTKKNPITVLQQKQNITVPFQKAITDDYDWSLLTMILHCGASDCADSERLYTKMNGGRRMKIHGDAAGLKGQGWRRWSTDQGRARGSDEDAAAEDMEYSRSKWLESAGEVICFKVEVVA